MKILIFHYNSVSGNETSAQKIQVNSFANALRKKNAFIVIHNASSERKDKTDRETIKNKKHKIFQILRGYGFKTLLLNFVSLKQDIITIKKHKPDVVLIWFQNLKFSAFFTCKLLHVPCVAFLDSPVAYLNRHFFENKFLPKLPETIEKICCKWSRSVVTISKISKFMLSKYGISSNKIFVSPDGVNLEMFKPLTKSSELRDTLGWTRNFVFGFIGAFRSWHNPEELVWVIKKLAKSRPHAHFLLVGDGPCKDYVENKLVKERSSGQVKMAGQVPWEDVPKYLQAMDAFLAPFIKYDYFFPSPLKIVESMAVGVPVLTTAQGELIELIKDGKNSFLYDCGDRSALLKKALFMIDDPVKCKEMGKLARQTVEEERSWDKVVGPLWHSLCSVVERRAR